MPDVTSAKRTGSLKRQQRLDIAWRLGVALLAILFSMFPVILIFSTAINPVSTVTVTQIIPDNASLANFTTMLTDQQFPFTLWIWN